MRKIKILFINAIDFREEVETRYLVILVSGTERLKVEIYPLYG